MKRREFITLAGGVAVWPVVARAQQAKMPVIGFLYSGAAEPIATNLIAFRKGLGEVGYVEGRNVAIEFRTAELEQFGRLPALLAEFISHKVAVIVSTGLENGTVAAKAATSAIPIVFTVGSDPVEMGLVSSFNRPGGNLTGLTLYTGELGPKRLELLNALVPNAATIGLLVNPYSRGSDADANRVVEAARSKGQNIIVVSASTENEIEVAFGALVQQKIDALLVDRNVFFTDRRNQLAALTARYSIPASFANRLNVTAGGLMSYGDDRTAAYHHLGVYTGRILNGETPSNLPIIQPMKFELVVNLKTAKALGLTIPESFLVRADEVIE